MNFVLVYGFRSSHWHLPDLSHSYWTDKHLGRAAILNKINFASLIATNAAIHRLLAPKSLLFEFGLRRAQGHDGAVTASKYALLGGFDYTSNCVAAKLHKLPLAGSMSHSFVTSFASFNEVDRQLPSNVLEKTRQIREKIRNVQLFFRVFWRA